MLQAGLRVSIRLIWRHYWNIGQQTKPCFFRCSDLARQKTKAFLRRLEGGSLNDSETTQADGCLYISTCHHQGVGVSCSSPAAPLTAGCADDVYFPLFKVGFRVLWQQQRFLSNLLFWPVAIHRPGKLFWSRCV